MGDRATSDSDKAPPLDALTGVRFFAAFAVLNFHYMSLERWGIHVPTALTSVVGSGNAGVTLFFMLSGFVLAYSNSSWEFSRNATLRFWSGRVARIYPTYILAMAWFAPFILLHRFSVEPPSVAITKSAGSFIPALFLVQSWFYPRFATAWNGPAWTLSVEAAFYLCFPFIAARVRGLSQSKKLALCLGCWTVTAMVSRVDPLIVASTPTRDALFTYNPLVYLPTFVSGIALGYHYVQRTSNSGAVLAVSALLSIMVIAAHAHSLPFLFALEAAFLPAFAALIYGLALGGWPARLLSQRWLVILGESSYALYILQFSIAFTLMFIEHGFIAYDVIQYGRLSQLSQPVFYIVDALVSIGISVVVSKFYEVPLRRELRRRLFSFVDRRQPGVPTTALPEAVSTSP